MHRERVHFAVKSPRPKDWEGMARALLKAEKLATDHGAHNLTCRVMIPDPRYPHMQEWQNRAQFLWPNASVAERSLWRSLYREGAVAVLVEGWALKD